MIFKVYEGEQPAGDLTLECSGLYYEIHAKIQNRGIVQRIYGICGTESYYIGIPDKNGELNRRVSRKQFPIPEKIILSEQPKAQDRSFLISEGLGETTSQKESKKIETVDDGTMDSVEREIVRQTPQIDIESGGEENETHTKNYCNDIDPLLLADLPADYDYGGTEEADRDYV